ncbi:MAG: DUF1249 domain-containing protein [Pseudomonadota bacterium]
MLRQLLPSLHPSGTEVTHSINDASRLIIRIKECCKYTTVLTLIMRLEAASRLVSDMVFEIRVYHDLCVAEATHYQGQGRFQATYPRHNDRGYHEDEKHQANRLLQECLKYSLKHLPAK